MYSSIDKHFGAHRKCRFRDEAILAIWKDTSWSKHDIALLFQVPIYIVANAIQKAKFSTKENY